MKVNKKNLFLALLFFLLACFFITVIVFSVITANEVQSLKNKKSDLESEINVLKNRLKIAKKIQKT